MIYYHFNIPTVGPFLCADTHMWKCFDVVNGEESTTAKVIVTTRSTQESRTSPPKSKFGTIKDIKYTLTKIKHSENKTNMAGYVPKCIYF